MAEREIIKLFGEDTPAPDASETQELKASSPAAPEAHGSTAASATALEGAGSQQNAKGIDVFVGNIRPMSITPSHKRRAMEIMFERYTNLREGQYRGCPWGFPIIPVPEARAGNGQMRMAPENVDPKFLGHPIYWIHPKLTDLREGETYEAWAIRMFYLILAFGYWKDPQGKARWINHVSLHRVKPDYGDLQSYFQAGNPTSVFDNIPLLDTPDLKVSLEEVDGMVAETMYSITNAMFQEISHFVDSQISSIMDTCSLLDIKYQSITSLTPPKVGEGSIWEEEVKKNLDKALNSYERVAADSNFTRDIYDSIQQALEDASVMLLGIDFLISDLTLPSIRAIDADSDMYSRFVAAYDESMNANKRRASAYDFTGNYTFLFSNEAWVQYTNPDQPNPAEELRKMIHSLYENAESRLRLALWNSIRVRDGMEPVSSIDDMRRLEELAFIDGIDSFDI